MLGLLPTHISNLSSLNSYPLETGEKNDSASYKIEYQGTILECSIEYHARNRLLRYQNCQYRSLYDLLHFAPSLPLDIIAKILNFFISMNSDQVILEPEDYIDKYNSLYASDLTNQCYNHLSAYDHYDTSQITLPRIEDQKLIYFIERDNIPYRVSCPWPITSENPNLKYEALNSID